MRYLNAIADLLGGLEPATFFGVCLCAIALGAMLVGKIVKTMGRSVLAAWRRRVARKREKLERDKRLQYALPDRENRYLQTRLHTALRAEKPDDFFLAGDGDGSVKMRYARKMLAHVKEAALSPVERLDVEEMAGALAVFQKKEKWSNADLKALNEIFSRLLKLSAKYQIAV